MPPAVGEQAPKPVRRAGLARVRGAVALAGVFALLAVRYWLMLFPRTTLELRRLRARAAAIPDASLRRLALAALCKRSNIEGAAAFAALVPGTARANVTRALVAFQSIYNYADALAEEPGREFQSAAATAHGALLLALCAHADAPPPDASGLQAPDGPYLLAQIESCRRALHALPSSDRVIAPALVAASDIWEFQTRISMASELERWARPRRAPAPCMSWWESAGAAGSSLAVHALIAAAADPTLEPQTVERLLASYGGPIGAVHTLLDSLVDESEDARIGQVSLVGCYASQPAAAERMGQMAARAMLATRTLPHARRHAVLVASMMSLYTSDPHARTDAAAPIAAAVRAAAGPVGALAHAVFALRRWVARAPRWRRSDRCGDQQAREPEHPATACASAR